MTSEVNALMWLRDPGSIPCSPLSQQSEDKYLAEVGTSTQRFGYPFLGTVSRGSRRDDAEDEAFPICDFAEGTTYFGHYPLPTACEEIDPLCCQPGAELIGFRQSRRLAGPHDSNDATSCHRNFLSFADAPVWASVLLLDTGFDGR